jgi:hypothetical protein
MSRSTLGASAAFTLLCLTACSSGGDDAPAGVPYPTAPDALEAHGGNDTVENAARIAVGSSRPLTLYPASDRDWFKVDLVKDTEYEITTGPISANSDTYLYLYGPDGTTLLSSDDDWMGYDSEIPYTPAVSGTYYLMVEAYDETYGIATYEIAVRPFEDADGDGFSATFDCDDAKATINPDAEDVAGDGIDQDCNGADALDASVADRAEDDDTAAQARTLTLVSSDGESPLGHEAAIRANARTHHEAGDQDWFKVTVTAHGAVDVISLGNCADAELLDSDATTSLDVDSCGYFRAENTTGASKTFYVRYTAEASFTPNAYAPAGIDVGVDRDGDGFYTRDWGDDRDCDDGEADVHPGVSEIYGDSVDQDCDGGPNTEDGAPMIL